MARSGGDGSASGHDVLRVHAVDYTYSRLPILRRVELRLSAGEVVALLGCNGAGKSTLLRCAAGWSAPSAGEIEFLGEPLRTADRRARAEIVFVSDAPPFYDDLTGREHVEFALRANRRADELPNAERLLERFGLSAFADAYPGAYSRDMRYKFALVLALAMRPRALLLDEPFGSLDPASTRECWAELRALADSGSAVLFSCHHMPEGVAPDCILMLADGALTEVSRTDALTASGDDTCAETERAHGA